MCAPAGGLNAEAFPYLQAIVLSSDGHNLVTGGEKGVVEVWQACDFKQLYVYPGCDAGIRAMDLSHDQRSEQTVYIYIYKYIHIMGCRLKVLDVKES